MNPGSRRIGSRNGTILIPMSESSRSSQARSRHASASGMVAEATMSHRKPKVMRSLRFRSRAGLAWVSPVVR